MWTSARKGTLKPGDTAPDLNVQMLEGKEPLALSGLWANKPVVLVFGSYT
jgi:peroxiredoxin